MKKNQNAVLVIIFIVCLFVPRFTQIERPITVDELTWLTFSSDFLYGLAGGEYEHTYQDHHPGVTTMMAGTAAYVIEGRSYRAVQGYVENDTFMLIDRLEESGFSIFDVLVTARRLMALASSLVLLLSLWFLWKLWGPFPAWVAMMFVILDPMVIGQTRLYSHEGLMSSLIFLSWISFFHYLKQGRKWASLLVSSLSIGFAVLTKITALGLLPVVAVALIVEIYQQRKAAVAEKQSSWTRLMPLGLWLLGLIAVFIAFWPAAWANPLQTVIRMVNHTLGFTGSGNLIAVSERDFSNILDGIAAYSQSIWAHPTLITWLGNLVALLALVFWKKLKPPSFLTEMSVYLYVYSGIVIVAIGGMSSFRADRYMTSVNFFIALLGGLGIAALADWMKQTNWVQNREWFSWVALAGVLVVQVGFILPARPYYYTYLNPLARNVWWGVHGAFLDQAADYLAEKPDAESLTVMTFSPGSFMFFFPGDTRLLTPYPSWNQRDAHNLQESDYLLVNFELTHLSAPPRILAEIADVEPEHVISFQGRDYVWVYLVDDLPDSVFSPDSQN
jgi:hypothetical protein